MMFRRRPGPGGLLSSQQQVIFLLITVITIFALGILYTRQNEAEHQEMVARAAIETDSTEKKIKREGEDGSSKPTQNTNNEKSNGNNNGINEIYFDFNCNILHVVEFLKPEAEYVYILIHGASKTTQNAAYWKAVIPSLRKTGTVYAIDLFGHGESVAKDKVDSTLQTQSIISFIEKHIRKENKNQHLIIVGRSAGGATALDVAEQIPPAALILTAPAIKESQLSGESNKVTSLPVLLLWSTEDPVIPFSRAESIKSAFTHASLVTIDTPTHTLEEQEPSWWSSKVMKFMKDHFYHKAIAGLAKAVDHLGDEDNGEEKEREYPE